jgi:hypothetical protein
MKLIIYISRVAIRRNSGCTQPSTRTWILLIMSGVVSLVIGGARG